MIRKRLSKRQEPNCDFCNGKNAKLGYRTEYGILALCQKCSNLKQKAKHNGIGQTLQSKTWSKGVWKNYNRINPLSNLKKASQKTGFSIQQAPDIELTVTNNTYRVR